MTLSHSQQAELLQAAKPLIQWMNENCHPHCSAVVDQSTVGLSEMVAAEVTTEFLKD